MNFKERSDLIKYKREQIAVLEERIRIIEEWETNSKILIGFIISCMCFIISTMFRIYFGG